MTRYQRSAHQRAGAGNAGQRGAGLQSVARRLIGDNKHFWQARYYDFNVWTARKRVEKLRYIHRNPVKRGLVEKPEDWRWSSFRNHATGEEGVVEIESEWTGRKRERMGIVPG